MSADILEIPCAAIRASSAASSDEPIPVPRDVGRRCEEDDPALRVRGSADRRADDLVADHRHDGMVLGTRGENVGEPVDRLCVRREDLLPQPQDAVDIVGVVVADAPAGHGVSLDPVH